MHSFPQHIWQWQPLQNSNGLPAAVSVPWHPPQRSGSTGSSRLGRYAIQRSLEEAFETEVVAFAVLNPLGPRVPSASGAGLLHQADVLVETFERVGEVGWKTAAAGRGAEARSTKAYPGLLEQ